MVNNFEIILYLSTLPLVPMVKKHDLIICIGVCTEAVRQTERKK